MKRIRAAQVVLAVAALAVVGGCTTSASKGWAQTARPLEMQAPIDAVIHLGVTADEQTPRRPDDTPDF